MKVLLIKYDKPIEKSQNIQNVEIIDRPDDMY